MVAKEDWPIGITDWFIEAPNEPDSYIPLYTVKNRNCRESQNDW